MGTVTLATLRSRARSRADQPIAGFVTEAELTDWINEGVQQLHEKLVSAYGEEYVSTSASLVVAAGVAPLPAAFFKLQTIEMNIGGSTCTLLPYTQQERNAYKNALGTGSKPRYKLVAGNVKLLPVQANGTLVEITYAPEATLLVNIADSISFPNGWEKYVVLYAAIQMMDKEETGTTKAQQLLEQWNVELKSLVESRDAAAPKQSVDLDLVEGNELEPWRF